MAQGTASRTVGPSYFRGGDCKYPEVIFPNEFTTIHPWMKEPKECPVEIGSLKEIPTVHLAHITHKKEASEIIKTKVFRAGQKLGKQLGVYDGSPCGESFYHNDGLYTQISSNETVFQGFFSWWGIFPTENQEDLQEELDDIKRNRTKLYVADYLKPEPESRYGADAFVCQFRILLEAYAISRGTEVANIFLKIGGTLRYTNEICYVIILCTNQDQEALKCYNPLKPSSGPFDFNNIIDGNGKITYLDKAPIFLPKHVIKWHFGDNYSFETTAFAFYFPDKGSGIKLRHDQFKHTKITHIKCLKKRPHYGDWKCPDDIL